MLLEPKGWAGDRIDRRRARKEHRGRSRGAPRAAGAAAARKALGRSWIAQGLAHQSDHHLDAPAFRGAGRAARTIIGPMCVVSDPAAIKHVLVDNARNYRKGVLQTRVLRPGLGNGLLTAEGESWRSQRRALAPAFTPRLIESFQPAMASVAATARRALARASRCEPDRCGARDDACDARSARAHDLFGWARERARDLGASDHALSRHARARASFRCARPAGFAAPLRARRRQGGPRDLSIVRSRRSSRGAASFWRAARRPRAIFSRCCSRPSTRRERSRAR